MIWEKYDLIMKMPRKRRERWALYLASISFIVIFLAFVFHKGYFDLNSSKSSNQMAGVAVNEIPSPIKNAKEIFIPTLGEITAKYRDLKDSLSDVFVPFITSIEVYERR